MHLESKPNKVTLFIIPGFYQYLQFTTRQINNFLENISIRPTNKHEIDNIWNNSYNEIYKN